MTVRETNPMTQCDNPRLFTSRWFSLQRSVPVSSSSAMRDGNLRLIGCVVLGASSWNWAMTTQANQLTTGGVG